jgi:hypothetical protein
MITSHVVFAPIASLGAVMRIPEWMLNDFPWLADVVDAFEVVKAIWHQWDSVVLLVGLYIVGRRLKQERISLGQGVDTLSEIVKAARDLSETALAQPSNGGASQFPAGAGSGDAIDPNGWETIRRIWRDTRDRIELAIEEVPRRSRGKYSRIRRYNYLDVIDALRKDGVLGPAVANKLQGMDTRFNTLKFQAEVNQARGRYEL